MAYSKGFQAIAMKQNPLMTQSRDRQPTKSKAT